MKKNELRVGFIGCGKMAGAIISGVISSGFLKKTQLCASEINEEFAQKAAQRLGIEVFVDNKFVAKNSDVIFIATKPHFVQEILEQIKPEIQGKLLVSIAAGIKTEKIENIIGKAAVIRVMPNTPALILEGMSGVCAGKFATHEQVQFVQDFLENIGKCIVVDEGQMDVLTAISGSGPAYFYKIIEDMARAGEKLGLDYEKSLLLALQTAIGSAKMIEQSDLSLNELIQSVATKGGCTEVGINYMADVDTQSLFSNLIEKTAVKSKELG